MSNDDLLTRMALGAAAGAAGTVAMVGLLTGSQQYLPQTLEPLEQDPGEFMVERAQEALPERAEEAIPEPVESAAAQSLHFGYGMTWGALYAAVRPHGGNPLVDGAALGLGVWGAGYLGWIPAVGLAPPVSEHEPEQLLGSIGRHALYGIVTTATYQQLRNL